MARPTRLTLALLLAAALAACGGGGTTGGAGGAVDTTPPTVVATSPATTAAGVAAGAVLSVTFSEPMDVGTVTVTLTPSASLGVPAWSSGNKVVTYTPTAPLAPGTAYTASVAGKDLAGNALTPPPWGFSTAAAAIPNNWDVAAWDQGTWQ